MCQSYIVNRSNVSMIKHVQCAHITHTLSALYNFTYNIILNQSMIMQKVLHNTFISTYKNEKFNSAALVTTMMLLL